MGGSIHTQLVPWNYLKPRLSQTLLGRFHVPTITHPNVNERRCCRSKPCTHVCFKWSWQNICNFCKAQVSFCGKKSAPCTEHFWGYWTETSPTREVVKSSTETLLYHCLKLVQPSGKNIIAITLSKAAHTCTGVNRLYWAWTAGDNVRGAASWHFLFLVFQFKS